MKSPVLLPLAQIEWTIADLEAPRALLSGLFGCQPIEEEFAASLEGPHMNIAHVGLGQTVLQLCQPLIEQTGHWHALQQWGPHVYNLTWFVDELAPLLERIEAAGLELEWHFPLGQIYERVLPAENLSGSLEAAMVAASEAVGFNLELAETPWGREPTPRLFYPAYHPEWPDRGERTGRLEQINLVTPDVARAIDSLVGVFGDAADVRRAPTANASVDVVEAEVVLGEVRLHYMQPGESAPPELRVPERGASVHSVALPVPELASTEASAARLGIAVEPCAALLFEPGAANATANTKGARRLATSGVLGIDLIVAEVDPVAASGT